MHKSTQRTKADSPFFNLLADADEVQIREIPSDQPERMVTSLEKTLRDFEYEKDSKNLRTFFVHIKTPPAPAPVAPKSAHDPELLTQSAELLLENQDYVLARNLYSFLLEQNLKNPAALRGLGICLYRLGEVVSSRKCFRALVELFQNEEAHYWLGVGYQGESKDAIAVTHFEQIKKPEAFTADQRFDFFKCFGNCLTRLSQLDRAEGLYLKALELSPTSDTIHVNLGTLFIQKKDWPSAIARFARAVELNPKSSRALCGLGLATLASGKIAEAKTHLNRALDLDVTNLVAIHQLLEIAKEPHESPILKARLRAYLEKDPKNADIHHALATLLFKEGCWKECEYHNSKAMELAPGNPSVMKLSSDLNSLVRSQS
jgi:Flp pilus assembly protein TadD